MSDLIHHSLFRVVLSELVPALQVHLGPWAQPLLGRPLSLQTALLLLLHVSLQLHVQCAPQALLLLLALLLHHLTGQDVVIGLALATAHADAPLHSHDAQLGGHRLLALLLHHGAPDVVDPASGGSAGAAEPLVSPGHGLVFRCRAVAGVCVLAAAVS